MFTNTQNNKFYIYDCYKNAYIHVCDGIDELIEYLSEFNATSWWGPKKRYNHFLEDYNCTTLDVKRWAESTESARFVIRRYIVFDVSFRIIDVRIYEKEILAYETPHRKIKWRSSADEYRYEKTRPNFRNGPVPGTGHNGWKFKNYYRRPATTRELRDICNPENKDYIRNKRKYIPTSWDDIPRGHSRSWKDQSKKRKQWM